jgi:hypothetical protein
MRVTDAAQAQNDEIMRGGHASWCSQSWQHSSSSSIPLRAGLEEQFAATSWGKKLEKRRTKAGMTDLDRFKAMVQKTTRARAVRKAYKQMQATA